jgi:tetrathionate reductase subunit A
VFKQVISGSDPTRKQSASMLNDYWTGTNCRHGIPI